MRTCVYVYVCVYRHVCALIHKFLIIRKNATYDWDLKFEDRKHFWNWCDNHVTKEDKEGLVTCNTLIWWGMLARFLKNGELLLKRCKTDFKKSPALANNCLSLFIAFLNPRDKTKISPVCQTGLGYTTILAQMLNSQVGTPKSKTTVDVKKWSALRVFNIDRYVQKQSGETGLPEVDIHISPKKVEAFGHLKSVLG